MATKYKLGDFLNDINSGKKNIIRQDPDAIKDYVPFVINMMLSYHSDCVGIVNELNCRPNMPIMMQYDFLINLIRKSRRFARHTKSKITEDVQLLMNYYNYSEQKATEALLIMPTEKLTEIRKSQETGGRQ